MDPTLILPATAITSVAVLILVKLYTKLRTKFPITVNCWFCSSNTKVPYNSSNSWYCPACDQYNGFTSDGSYNRLLPEQYNEKLNCGSWCSRTKQKYVASNGLCQFCNVNLHLKVQQLANFSPINRDNYDEEVQQYSDQLERVYRLCPRCQNILGKTLNDRQEKYITNNQHTFTASFSNSILPPREKESHLVCVGLTAVLSVGLVLSQMPYHWVPQLIAYYPLPDYLLDIFAYYPLPDYLLHVLSSVQEHFPKHMQSSALLFLGMVVQLFDCTLMRDTSSFVNVLLWTILLSLTRVSGPVDGLVSIVHILAGIVFFITSIAEYKKEKPIAAVKPVQFQKLDRKSELVQENTNLATEKPISKTEPSNSPAPDPSPIRPVTPFSHEPIPEDFGFGKLNVSSRRVTRSQTKPFQTKQYGSQTQTGLFQPKPITLTPPKLQLDKHQEYQLPLTRSSSQSSGFVSLSHQKDFEEYRSPSIVADNMDSVSQCGRELAPYRSPAFSPASFSHPYGMPFSQFQPYTIVHYTPPHFNKFYQYSNISPYESSLNLSTFSVNKTNEKEGWFQQLRSALSSVLFLVLITTNVAVLWKVFGEDYFKEKS